MATCASFLNRSRPPVAFLRTLWQTYHAYGRFKLYRVLAIFAAVSISAPASAEEAIKVSTIAGWSIYRDDESKTCRMVSAFENNEVLFVTYDAAEKGSVVTFTEKQATSLKDGEKRKVDILLSKGGALDDGWEDTDFRVSVRDNGQRVLSSQSLDDPFLEDIAKSSAIRFAVKGHKIDTYNLSGSGKAVAALRSCAMKAAGLNPLDPFAR